MKHKLFWFIIISLLFVSGCWDLEDVDRRAFMTAIGVDAVSANQVSLTVQIPLLEEVLPPGTGQGGNRGKDFQTIAMNGRTVFEAYRKLQMRVERHLVIQQKQLLVVGAEAARLGVNPVLDWLVRSPKTPPHCLILVAKNPRTAREILQFTPATKTMPGITSDISRRTITKSDRTYFMPTWLFRQKLLHESKDVYATLLDLDEAQGQYVLEGLAVFNGHRMAGELNAEETQSFGLLTNQMKAGGMTFDFSSDIAGPKYSIQTVHGKTRIKVFIRHGRPYFLVQTNIRAVLNEIVNFRNQMKIPLGFIRKLETKIQTEVETRLTKTIEKLQQLNSDPIDFGEQFRVQHPKVWKQVVWKKIFPEVPYSVRVKVKILREGIMR